MSGPPDPRRRLLAALLLGLLLGVGLLWLAVGRLQRAQAAELVERRAIVSLLALAEVATRARAGAALPEVEVDPYAAEEAREAARSAAVARVAARWAQRQPGVEHLRVVDLGGRALVASTDPADRRRGEPPRRLERDEKPLFDLGQRLRGVVEAARSGGPREEQIVVEPRRGRRMRLSAPWRDGAEVIGLVQVDTAPASAAAPAGLPLALAAALLPFALFAAAASVPGLREHPRALSALAALLLVAGVAGYAWAASRTLSAGRVALAGEVSRELGVQVATAREVLAAAGVETAQPVHGRGWDADVYGRPREEIGVGARVDGEPSRLARAAEAAGDRVWRSGAGAFGVALLAFLFLATGAAGRTGRALVRYRVAYAYAIPALLGMALLTFLPFLYGVALAFTNANIYNSDRPLTEIWVGLDNFADILGDFALVKDTPEGRVIDYHNFYWTAGFTIVWTVVNVAGGVTGGLILALILNTPGLALRPIYRVLFILPWAMPNYITALIWKGMFHRQFGVINQVIQLFGGEPISWFERPLTSFATVLATNGWLSFPFMMVICLGALQSIPGDVYEAARVDGASRWQQLRHITLPSLKPALIPAIIISVIWTFNMFNIIFLVSEGEPGGATEILISEAYKIAFQQYRYGYAAAYSVVIFVILYAYGTFQNRATRATEAIA
jgi:arabinogalactan oligomer/maltooligosaccharide transport system permease protein